MTWLPSSTVALGGVTVTLMSWLPGGGAGAIFAHPLMPTAAVTKTHNTSVFTRLC